MKLKNITIHNIASIADATIDFDGAALRDESLFLICGETGSGKTTVLDALCLALYNRTPRLSQASLRDSYTDVNGEQVTLGNPAQYLRKGTWEAFVELDFEAGGKNWKSRWSIRRANRKAEGRFQPVVWELVDVDGGLTLKGSEAEHVIGLGFDEFRRTSMLAQGEFTAFLKSRDDEKSAILEKMTGTGIYKEIGREISDRYRSANQQYSARQEALQGLKESLLRDEEVEALKEEIRLCRLKADALENERKVLEKADGSFAQIARLEQEIRQQMRMLELSCAGFPRLKGGIRYAGNALEHEREALAAAEAAVMKGKPYAEMYSECQLIAAELDRISADEEGLKKTEENIRIEAAAMLVLQQDIERMTAELKEKQKACQTKEMEVAGLRKELSAMQPERLRQTKAAVEQIMRLSGELKTKDALVRQAEADLEAVTVRSGGLRDEAEAADRKLKEITVLYDRMKECNEQWAKDARASLMVGETCPVCGQLIATKEYLESISDEHFESVLEPVFRELSACREKADAAGKAYAENQAQVLAFRKLLDSRRQEYSYQAAVLEALRRETKDICESEEAYADICRSLESADRISAELEAGRSSLEQMQKELSEEHRKVAQVQISHEKTVALHGAALKSMEETLARIAVSYDYLSEAVTWEDWKERWNIDRKAFRDDLLAEAAAYHEALGDSQTRAVRIERIKEGLENIRLLYEDIVELIPELAEADTDEPRKVERLEAELNSLKTDIMTAAAVKASAGEKLAAERACVEGLDAQHVAQRLKEVVDEVTLLNQKIGSCEKTLALNDVNMEKAGKELAVLEKAGEDRDQWKALNDVFGRKDGEYFQKIAQGFIMNDILGRANHYLKTMTGRYLLESQKGSLNILVRDMEQGGVPRSTSTISGGESFIISLALALGLSSLGVADRSSDILFIDEGFGSLSEDYLNTVIETLQRLHETSGKKVGIISHVEQLGARIGTKIHVSRISQTASKVEIVSA